MSLDNIIIIDDESNQVKATVRLLNEHGFDEHYNLITHVDSKQFFDADLSNTGIVISDVLMPDYDGFDVLKHVRNNETYIPFIFLSGSDLESEKVVEALKSGADDFISKTADDAEKLIRIEIAIKKGELYKKKYIAEAQVLQSEKMATVGELTAGIVHEINTPVGFISSNINTLNKYVEKVREYLDQFEELQNAISQNYDSTDILELSNQIKETKKRLKIDYIVEDIGDIVNESLEGTDRLKEIISNLKLFSRQENDKPTNAYINEGIKTTLKVAHNQLKYHCTIDEDYSELPQINCFPQQLNQIVLNLLVNASHAIEKEGVITIRTGMEDSYQYVSISDTGTGISSEVQKQIFKPFYTTKEKGKGTGLGLSICYDIAQKHGGHIEVDSKIGKGTTFKVYIKGIDEC